MSLDASQIARALPPGSMRYYAWLYTPEQFRDVLAALFIIESELHDSARAAHEVAHVRLQWWREEFDRLAAGNAQHPATRALHVHVNAHALATIDLSLLQGVHLSAAQELANSTFETDAELERYLQSGLGNLLQLATQLMTSAPSEAQVAAANQLGRFIRNVEILRDLRMDFHHGRLFLPLGQLDELGIEYEALQQREWPASFATFLKQRSTQQIARYRTLTQSLLDDERSALRPLRVLAALHAAVLEQVATDPDRQTRQRVELSPARKLWTAWRTALFN